MKVKIKDFQGHGNTEFEVMGMTFVRGPNNDGKTSTVRAIQAALYGRAGSDHIRHGTKGPAVVGIDFEADADNSPLSVVWTKGKGGSKYLLNKESYQRLGKKGVPEDELAQQGIKEIGCSAGKIRLQFWDQRTEPFLVSLPPTQAFDFVSRTLEERKIIPVLKKMSTDIKELRDKALIHEGEIKAREDDLAKASSDVAEAARVLVCEADVLWIVQAADELKQLFHDSTWFNRAGADYDQYSYELGLTMERIQGIEPLVIDVGTCIGFISLSKGYLELVSSLTALQASLTKVESSIAAFPDLDRSVVELNEIKTLTWDRGLLRSWKEAVDASNNEIQAVDIQLERLGELGSLEDIREEVQEAGTLKSDLKVLREWTRRKDTLVGALEGSKEMVTQTKEEVKRALEALGQCPLCGSRIGGRCGHSSGRKAASNGERVP